MSIYIGSGTPVQALVLGKILSSPPPLIQALGLGKILSSPPHIGSERSPLKQTIGQIIIFLPISHIFLILKEKKGYERTEKAQISVPFVEIKSATSSLGDWMQGESSFFVITLVSQVKRKRKEKKNQYFDRMYDGKFTLWSNLRHVSKKFVQIKFFSVYVATHTYTETVSSKSLV